MTIKHTDKNISAEDANVITNVAFNDATGTLTFSQKNFYTEATTSFALDLSGVQLGVVTLNNQAALATLEADSTKEDYKKTHLFLVPLSNGGTNNIYEEYVYVETSSNTWEFEKIGSTALDLSNYIQKSQTSGLIKNDGTVDTNSYSTTSHTHTVSNITNLTPVSLVVTYTDNTTETLTLFKQNNSP